VNELTSDFDVHRRNFLDDQLQSRSMLAAIAAFKSAYASELHFALSMGGNVWKRQGTRSFPLCYTFTFSYGSLLRHVFHSPAPLIAPPRSRFTGCKYDAVSPPSSLEPRYYLDFHRSEMPALHICYFCILSPLSFSSKRIGRWVCNCKNKAIDL